MNDIDPKTIISVFDDKITLLEHLKACKPLYMHRVEVNARGTSSGEITTPVYVNVLSSKKNALTIEEFSTLTDGTNEIGTDDDGKLFSLWHVGKDNEVWKLHGYLTATNDHTGNIESFLFTLVDVVINDVVSTL